jgi:hypothetical protein
MVKASRHRQTVRQGCPGQFYQVPKKHSSIQIFVRKIKLMSRTSYRMSCHIRIKEMIAKFKALITPILGKLPHLRKAQRAEEETGPGDDKKTHKAEDTDLALSQKIAQEEEPAEDARPNPSYVEKALGWLKLRLPQWQKKQQDHEPEMAEEDATLVIRQVQDVDVPLETEDQLEENSSGKLADLKNRVWQKARRKIVWIPALALVLSGIGATLTVSILNKMSAQEQALHHLQIQAKKLEQENQALKDPRKKVMVTAAMPPVPELPLPAVSRPEIQTTSKGNIPRSDCVLSGKTNVRESLKSCIEAFNASSN